MVAASAATGVRSWLQTRDWSFLTPHRLKVATVVLFALALSVSALRLSGSTPTQAQAHQAPVHAGAR